MIDFISFLMVLIGVTCVSVVVFGMLYMMLMSPKPWRLNRQEEGEVEDR